MKQNKKELNRNLKTIHDGIKLFNTNSLLSNTAIRLNGSPFKDNTSLLEIDLRNACISLNARIHKSETEWFYIMTVAAMWGFLGLYKNALNRSFNAWFYASQLHAHYTVQSLKLCPIIPEEYTLLNTYPDVENTYNLFLNSQPRQDEQTISIFNKEQLISSLKDYYSNITLLYFKPVDWESKLDNAIQYTLTNKFEIDLPIYQEAKTWIENNLPVIASLSATFKLETDPEVIDRLDIKIAAISATSKTLYINSRFPFNSSELVFILAHELLHIALKHHERQGYRDSYIWNLACDYVINYWLVEMKIGTMPSYLLYDSELKNLSAEEIYDILVTQTRIKRKLKTLNGDKSDILDNEKWWLYEKGVPLEQTIRELLKKGLALQLSSNISTIPAGLLEEIKASVQEPIPWDVELARWFDEQYADIEKIRSFSRASRRQAINPDIPLPARIYNPESSPQYQLGVLLDTSGSMSSRILGKALGAIYSYSEAKNIKAIRLICCDAAPYDHGFITPIDLIRDYEITGRGGTQLQPALDLFEESSDFPRTSPILIITDGGIFEPKLYPKFDHAYLLPLGNSLPYHTNKPIFYIK